MNCRRYDEYGWTDRQIDQVAADIGDVLAIEFEARNSLYRGDYYRWHGPGEEDLILQENFVEDDDGLPTDDRHPHHVVLLYASRLPHEWFDRLAAIPGAERLASRTVS
ncbi:MAG TPA: hypothetical protein VMT69_14035 [Kineosporiaceae bacterium]|nr:hypothetical protein [Kineosporiaceae bacterium]